MTTKKSITAVSKVLNENTLQVLQNKLKGNYAAMPSVNNPNAAKLKDGAIQRASVELPFDKITTSQNPDKIGLRRRPHQGVESSGSAHISTETNTNWVKYQNKVARIYMPEKKHVHNHPCNKLIGKQWVIDLEHEGSFKSPLMQWTTASLDPFHTKGDNMQMAFPTVDAAVAYARSQGWGYDIMYPRHKYHTYKNYANNYKYKGEPKPEADYD